MSAIKFYYNKYPPAILYIMVIFGVALGFLVYGAVLSFSGIAKGPEYAPAYFKTHPDHAVYLIFGLIPVVMLIPVWVAVKCWGNRDEEAGLRLYEDSAVLSFRDREVRIRKNDFRLRTISPRGGYTAYTLKIPGQRRMVFVSSMRERKENKKKQWLSLDIAMVKLQLYQREERGEEAKTVTAVKFYEMDIVCGLANPSVFDDSPYYVDYESMAAIPDAPFVTCLIRERRNPVHVVGDMGIDTVFLTPDELNAEILRQQTILSVIELDEEISL